MYFSIDRGLLNIETFKLEKACFVSVFFAAVAVCFPLLFVQLFGEMVQGIAVAQKSLRERMLSFLSFSAESVL